MFKWVLISTLAFIAGYFLGKNSEEELQEKLNLFFKKFNKLSYEAKKLVYNSLNNLENINSDEIKVNFLRAVDFLKVKLEEVLEVEGFQEKINFSKKELDKFKELSTDKAKKISASKNKSSQAKSIENKKNSNGKKATSD